MWDYESKVNGKGGMKGESVCFMPKIQAPSLAASQGNGFEETLDPLLHKI